MYELRGTFFPIGVNSRRTFRSDDSNFYCFLPVHSDCAIIRFESGVGQHDATVTSPKVYSGSSLGCRYSVAEIILKQRVVSE